MSKKSLPYNGYVSFVDEMSNDFLSLAKGKVSSNESTTRKYKISYDDPQSSPSVRRSVRKELLSKYAEKTEKPLKKVAFDTRRIDQESTRNPRENLQYWHRSQPFIDSEEQGRIDVFGKLALVVQDIKDDFETDPAWHNSYVRVLGDAINRVLRVKQGDNDIGRSQLTYLEQLLDARYRLTMDTIASMTYDQLRGSILKIDEDLLKRGMVKGNKVKVSAAPNEKYLEDKFIELLKVQADVQSNLIKNNMEFQRSNAQPQPLIITTAPSKNDDALASLFGSGLTRKEGERVVERTVTIVIKDEVKE